MKSLILTVALMIPQPDFLTFQPPKHKPNDSFIVRLNKKLWDLAEWTKPCYNRQRASVCGIVDDEMQVTVILTIRF